MIFRDPLDDRQVDAERLAGFAQGVARPIGGDRRGQRRAIAAVLAIDVLHHLFAPLMLEIDVDMVPVPTLPIIVVARPSYTPLDLPERDHEAPSGQLRIKTPSSGDRLRRPRRTCR
ncbi:hypothetical protein WL61_15190 [Burkholderia ubonensis]|nr:hypothetical protein WK14_24070 [Burkholderia ubonensis]KWD19923.1 hypothetical protein WL62_19215 [Burkholderia ubonensis]KWD21891.1 hypothetical protein WL61_15190 [Burkholderia ubonensis]